jgi:hypothetical protein
MSEAIENMLDTSKMTPEQKRRYEELQRKIKELSQKQRLIISRASQQDRKDKTRRAIVVGQLLQKKAEHDEKTKQALENLLLGGVEENQRYLFPEIWPKAVRATRRKQAQEENRETASV